MEFFLLCGIFLSLATIFFFHVLLTYKTKEVLPPGDFGYPIIGESLRFWSVFKAGKAQDFIFERMEKHSRDVFKSSLFGKPLAFMCGPEASKFLFANDHKLTKHWWPPAVTSVLGPGRVDPLTFKQIVLMYFKGDNIRKQIGAVDKVANAHFEREWQGRQEVVVFELARKYAFAVACRVVLSIEDAAVVDELQAQTKTILMGLIKLNINLPGTAYNRALKAWNALRDQLAEIVRERRSKLVSQSNKNDPNCEIQDVLASTLMVVSESEHHLSDMDIANRIIGVLLAIQDTSGATNSSVIKYIALHHEVYDAVLRENMEVATMKKRGERLNWEDIQKLKYSWNVVRESMRLNPPIDGLLRETISDFNYAGYRIPKGWKLYMSIKTIHMDPKYHPEPDKFDPSRFEGEGPLPNTYMPFGGGLSTCPGRHFAHVLTLVFLHNIVKRFKWELMPDSNNELILDPVPRTVSGTPIRLYPHPNKTHMV